jgi:hypothetical protein
MGGEMVSQVPAAPAGGSGSRVPLVAQIGVVAALGVAAALALATLFRPAAPSPAPLASLASSVTAVSPSPSVRPSPSATASPSPIPAPTPTPKPTKAPLAQVAQDRFLALIWSPHFSYHVDASGKTTTGRLRSRFRYSFDVSGHDFRGTITTRDLAATCHGVRKGNRVYAWCPGGGRSSRADRGGLWDRWPFMNIYSPDWLDPPRLVKVSGRTLVLLTTSARYSAGIDRMLNLNQHPDDGYPVRAAIWITTAGVPVKATFWAGPVEMYEGTMNGKANLVFSHVGRRMVIRAPW